MDFIVAYMGDKTREEEFRDTIQTEGLNLSYKRVRQLSLGHKDPEEWNHHDWGAVDREIERSIESGVDLHYVDFESSDWNKTATIPMVRHLQTLVGKAKASGITTGLYGLPLNFYWPPFTVMDSLRLFYYVKDNLDYISPQFYIARQSEDLPHGDFIRRIVSTVTMCKEMSPGKPIIPFLQLTTRGTGYQYNELSKQSVRDLFSTLAALNIQEVILWVDNWDNGGRSQINIDLIKKYSPWIKDAIDSVRVGN